MFRLIKWIVIITIIFSIWYLINFYLNMKNDEKLKIKQDVKELIDSGQVESIKSLLSKKIKEDLSLKKDQLFQYLHLKEKVEPQKKRIDGRYKTGPN